MNLSVWEPEGIPEGENQRRAYIIVQYLAISVCLGFTLIANASLYSMLKQYGPSKQDDN